jgi:hypothetical protein
MRLESGKDEAAGILKHKLGTNSHCAKDRVHHIPFHPTIVEGIARRDKPMTRGNQPTTGIDAFVIGTLVAGLLIVLLLVFANGGFPPDSKGLILGPTQPSTQSTTTSGFSKP